MQFSCQVFICFSWKNAQSSDCRCDADAFLSTSASRHLSLQRTLQTSLSENAGNKRILCVNLHGWCLFLWCTVQPQCCWSAPRPSALNGMKSVHVCFQVSFKCLPSYITCYTMFWFFHVEISNTPGRKHVFWVLFQTWCTSASCGLNEDLKKQIINQNDPCFACWNSHRCLKQWSWPTEHSFCTP